MPSHIGNIGTNVSAEKVKVQQDDGQLRARINYANLAQKARQKASSHDFQHLNI